MNILQVKKYCLRQRIEQAKFAYCSLGKSFEKQTEKQVGAVKSLKRFNNKKLLKTK